MDIIGQGLQPIGMILMFLHNADPVGHDPTTPDYEWEVLPTLGFHWLILVNTGCHLGLLFSTG
jgi:hypothetical protein